MSVNLLVLLVIIGYLLMNLSYSALLKHKVLFDVMMIATGFVLREKSILIDILLWIALVIVVLYLEF